MSMKTCLVQAREVSETKTQCSISSQKKNNLSLDIPKGFNWEEIKRLCVFIFHLKNDVNIQICYYSRGAGKMPKISVILRDFSCVTPEPVTEFCALPCPRACGPQLHERPGLCWYKYDPWMSGRWEAALSFPFLVLHWAWCPEDPLGKE